MDKEKTMFRNKKKETKVDYDRLEQIVAQNACSVNIDYDRLALSIVKALNDFKAQEAKDKEEQNEKQRIEVFNKLGIKPEGEKQSVIKKVWANFWMPVKYKREYVTDHSVISELLRLISITFFVTLMISSVVIGYTIILHSFFYESILDRLSYALVGFAIVYFSNVFRVASYEVDRMTDKEDINRTFSSIIALLGIIIAIIGMIWHRG